MRLGRKNAAGVLLAATLALMGCCAGTTLREQFEDWTATYGRVYDTEEEKIYRMGVWAENLRWVTQQNEEGHSWIVGMNSMADLTNEEYRSLYLASPVNYTVDSVDVTASIKNVDWKSAGAVTDVKSQGECDASWAFAATGGVEGCHEIATKKLQTLSEQQLIDCAGSTYGNYGCEGGTPDGGFMYIQGKGITNETVYPYEEERNDCHTLSSSQMVAHISSYKDVTRGSESGLQTSIESRPTPVTVDASLPSFQLYIAGVYCPDECSSTCINHAMLATGMSSNGYYVVKNSYGTGWGEQGYIWMCANKNNKCGIASAASYPSGCS
ncbi:cathepsin L2 [Pelomyxa schiedti]|nr:cathepsin L2 [Pelomyxa schiedti]